MGTLELRGYASFRKLFGQTVSHVRIQTPCTLEDCFDQLDRYFDHQLKPAIYDENGELDLWIRILLNGREITFLSGPERVVRDHDILLFIPVLGGG